MPIDMVNSAINKIQLCYLDGFDGDSRRRLSTVKDLCNGLFDELSNRIDNDFTGLQCIVFEQIHDFLITDMKNFCYKQDIHLFNKFKYLCDLNVTVEQLGGDPNYSIPLLSAVVELSMLDSYKCPIEKMNCLLTTYDLVYAELKSAIILMISKYSIKDIELPIINNNDVIPLLMLISIKSKLAYFHTNLLFIDEFYYKLQANQHHLMVFNIFKIIEQNLTKLNQTTLIQQNQSMDICDFFKLSTNQEQFDQTLTDQETKRIVDLITLSTSEN